MAGQASAEMERSSQLHNEIEFIISNIRFLLYSNVTLVNHKQLKLASTEPFSVLLYSVLSEVSKTDVHLQHGLLDLMPHHIIPGHLAVDGVYATAGFVTDVDQVGQTDIMAYLDVTDVCSSFDDLLSGQAIYSLLTESSP
ncbi:uncharacterized protein [Physcomitrium patens]|uniref:Uncharacterized protein n=1 Tax=Physcomitrium patens TaxID=3218 RepID=A9RYV8_PHYPA